MKESFGEKLKRARTQSGLKQSELAKTLGVKNTTISNWENNISKPDLDMLSYICGVLNVKASFFLEAHPPIEDIDCSEYEIIEKYRFIAAHSPDGASVVDTVLDREYAIANKLKEEGGHIIDLEERLVPRRIFSYHGKIAAAGTSYGFDDITSGTIEVPLDKANESADYTIGVSGDSMEPTYYDGDIVYVKKVTHLNVGDVGIFQKDNCIYIKEVGENGLISHNKCYKPMTDGGDVVCLGKVLGRVKK